MMKIYKIFALIMAFFLPGVVSAVEIANPLGTEDVQTVLKNILNALFEIIGVVAVAMIVYGGFQYMISGGDEKKVENAKKTITYAVIGLIVVILAGAIVNFIIKAVQG